LLEAFEVSNFADAAVIVRTLRVLLNDMGIVRKSLDTFGKGDLTLLEIETTALAAGEFYGTEVSSY
jgi:hypothetical protein